MNTRYILHIKKDGRCFFVLAEPFFSKYNYKHIDTRSKEFLEPRDVKYRLIEVKDGKPKDTIGFLSSIEPGSQILKVKKTPHSVKDCPPIIEYDTDFIYIIDKVYNF